MVGFYLGSLGEMEMKVPPVFKIVDAASGKEAFSGKLLPRHDFGFPFVCYQGVLEADFTAFKTPGEYRLLVPGLGASFSFFIDDADIAHGTLRGRMRSAFIINVAGWRTKCHSRASPTMPATLRPPKFRTTMS